MNVYRMENYSLLANLYLHTLLLLSYNFLRSRFYSLCSIDNDNDNVRIYIFKIYLLLFFAVDKTCFEQ